MTKSPTIKNCEAGDVFAYKIEQDEEYKGRYLLYIRCIVDEYEKEYQDESDDREDTLLTYRVKLTNDCKVPSSQKELDELPYIKLRYFTYERRHFPLSGKKTYEQLLEERKDIKFYPDEYGYLYCYITDIYKPKNIKKFEYLGNYNLKTPIKEYLPFTYMHVEMSSFKYIEENMLKYYRDFNLKQAYCYTKEGNKEIRENARRDVEFSLRLEKLMNSGKIKFDIRNRKLNYWSESLYGNDVAEDLRSDYKKFYNRSVKNGTSNQEMIDELIDYYEEYLEDPLDEPIFWMILANEQMKKKELTKEQKEKGLKAIEEDLENWKDEEVFNDRKAVLNKLKKKLETYECKE